MSEYIATVEDGAFIRCDFAQEIVRCRDCKHFYEADNYHPKGNYIRRCCNYFDTYNDEVEPDGFCAWGERLVGE